MKKIDCLRTCMTFWIAAFAMSAAAQTVTGSGTAGYVPVFTGSSIVGNSVITQSSSNVGIGTTSPAATLEVNGNAQIDSTVSAGYVAGTSTSTASGSFNANIDAGAVGQRSRILTGANRGYLDTVIELGGAADFVFGSAYGGAGDVLFVNTRLGDVGIGTTSPGAKLEVDGSIKLTASSSGSITFQDGTVQSTAFTGVLCGGDYAESVDVTGSRTNYEPGDLLVIDPGTPGKFLKSAEAYSTLVAGIYSTKPGTVGRRQAAPKSPDEVPMAMIGIVPTKVSAENGPIETGDLLVTSSTMGYAMKGTDRERLTGAVVGKALGSLDSGTGVIEVLVTLQ
jgi:hypothetical protein